MREGEAEAICMYMLPNHKTKSISRYTHLRTLILIALFLIPTFLFSVLSLAHAQTTPVIPAQAGIQESSLASIVSSLQSILLSLKQLITASYHKLPSVSPTTQLAKISGTDSGLVAHYTFDEGQGTTAGDSSGNGNTGTLTPTTGGPTWVTGTDVKVGSGAMSFDGVNDFVSMGNALDQTTNDFSISFWTRVQSYIDNILDVIFAKAPGNSTLGSAGYRLLLQNGGSYFAFNAHDGIVGKSRLFSSLGILDGQWHYVTLVWKRTTQPTLYFDGSERICATSCASDFTTLGSISNTNNFVLGIRNTPSVGYWYGGFLDDVRIYNRALDANEISQLYALGSTGSSQTDTQPPSIPTNLTSSNITQTGATIQWTASTDNVAVAGYKIYRNNTQIGTSNTTSFNDTDITAGTTYSYTISAYDTASPANTSVQSSPLFIATLAQSQTDTTPPIISSIQSTNITQTQATIGNLLNNSSFENGIGHEWAREMFNNSGNSPLLESDNWDTSKDAAWNFTAYDGRASIKLAFESPGRIISQIYRLKPNTQYTFSYYAKSSSPSWHVVTTVANTFKSPIGPGDVPVNEQRTTLNGTNWTKISHSFTTTSDISHSSYQIIIHAFQISYPNVALWLDAFQLEEGAIATDYQARNPVEIGLSTDASHLGNIFFEDETPFVKIRQNNNTGVAQSATVRYEVYDYYNRLVKQGNFDVSLGTHATGERMVGVSLPTNKRGAFRIMAWVDGEAGSVDEMNYSVLPRPGTMGFDIDSSIGANLPYKDYFLSLAQKMGIKWVRTSSPAGPLFRWNLNNPSRGVFTYHDAEVATYVKYGFTIFASLGPELGNKSRLPQWMVDSLDADDCPNFVDWEDYVRAMVTHYKGSVKYWEIWNEPDTANKVLPSCYSELLKRAHTVIKSVDPTAKVVGFSASNVPFMQQVLNNIGPGYMDYSAHHIYPGTQDTYPKRIVDSILTPYHIEGWNTETGSKSKTFYQTFLWEDQYSYPNSFNPSLDGGDYRDRADRLVRNYAATMGYGFTKYFYYDARDTSSLIAPISYSIFEWDGTLKAHGVAYAVVADLLGHAKGQGPVTLASGMTSTLFLRGTTPIIMLYNQGKTSVFTGNDVAKRVTFSNPSTVKVYDVMGNQQDVSSGITIGSSPIYIEGTGLSKDALISSISITDIDDTTPPNLSLVTYPHGPVDGWRVDFRWFSIDNIVRTNIVTKLFTNVVNYSYKLDGVDSDWSSWSPGLSHSYFNLPVGAYTFNIKARDYAGNESSMTKTFTVSNLSAGGSGDSGSNGTNSYTLSVIVNGNGSVSSLEYEINCPGICSMVYAVGQSVILAANPSSGSIFSGWSGGICSGTGNCTVTVNSSITVNAIFSSTLSPDLTPPTISLTSPTNNGTLSNTVPLSASVSDPTTQGQTTSGIAGVQFKLDGANLGTELTTPNPGTTIYEGQWNTTGVSNGTHTLTATARDQAGNTTTSNPVTITVNNPILPTPDITPPSTPTNFIATPISASQINLSWNPSTDPIISGQITSGLTGYRLFRNNIQIATLTGTSYSDTSLSPSTPYTYKILAYDSASNASPQSNQISATTQSLPPPPNPPVPTSGSPASILPTGTTQTTLSLVTDTPSTCRYSTTANTSYTSMTTAFSATGSTTHTSIISNLTDGITYTYYIRCDNQGISTQGDYIISFSVAAPPPAILPPSGNTGGGSSGGGGGGSYTPLPTGPSTTLGTGTFTPSVPQIPPSGVSLPSLPLCPISSSLSLARIGTFGSSSNVICLSIYQISFPRLPRS